MDLTHQELVLLLGLLAAAVIGLLLFAGARMTIRRMNREIAARREAERELQLSESRLRAAMQGTETGLWEWNPQTGDVYLDPVWFTMLGYQADDMPHEFDTFVSLLHPDDRASAIEIIETAASGKPGRFEAEFRMRRNDGSYCWILSKGRLLETGNVYRWIGIHSDLTERKKSQEALLKSEKKFRALVEQSPFSTIILTPDGSVELANEASAKLWSFTPEAMTEMYNSYNILKDEQAAKVGLMPYIERAFTGEKVVMPVVEYDAVETFNTPPLTEPAGRKRWIQARMYPIKDSAGKVHNVILLEEDVSERREAETQIRESEEKYRTLVENIPDVTWTTDIYGSTSYVSSNIEEIYGYSPDEICSDPQLWLGRIHEEDVGRVKHAFDSYFRTGSGFDIEYRIMHKKGHWVWFHDRSIAIYEKDGIKYADGVVSDITERKKTEQAIVDYQDRLKHLASELSRTEVRERRSIATDLHDQVGQSLAVMRMQLAAAIGKTTDPAIIKSLEDVSDSLRQAIQETRSIMYDISSPMISELGLSAAISEWLEKHIGEKYSLRTQFSDDGEDKPLSEDTRSILFRNVRELLVNVVKHAKATQVSVEITRKGSNIQIIVEDDGQGMVKQMIAEQQKQSRGFGLFSIEERMQDLGGSLSVENIPGHGVRAVITAPLDTMDTMDTMDKG